MSKRVDLMGTAGYRSLAIVLWCIFPLAGLTSGWVFLIIALGAALSANEIDGNVGRFLFFLVLSLLAFALCMGLGVWLGLKAWRKGKAGNAEQDHLD